MSTEVEIGNSSRTSKTKLNLAANDSCNDTVHQIWRQPGGSLSLKYSKEAWIYLNRNVEALGCINIASFR